MALRYFCSKGEMKWVSLMLWTGSDARAMGPSLDEKDPSDSDCYVSAMQQACYAGNVSSGNSDPLDSGNSGTPKNLQKG